MPINILMPALSPTMEKGNLAKWLKQEGDVVKAGDVIAEIETDKATMEVEVVDDGRLAKIVVPAGTADVPVNQLIAVLAGEGEDKQAAPAQPSPDAAKSPAKAPSNAAPPAAAATVAHPSHAAVGGRVFSSPLARRIAKEFGIDLAQVKGSGPHGRIVKRDIESAKGGSATPAMPQAPAATATAPAMSDAQIRAFYRDGSYEVIPHDSMRRIIAQRLVQAKQTIPHFYLTIDCDLTRLLAAREEINATAPKDKDGKASYKISVNDFVIKALAMALKAVPDANVTWTESGMLKHQAADVGVAVAIPGGLITPVVRDADAKSLSAISAAMKDYAARARNRRLKPEEYQGGSSAVSNLGMYGIKQFAAVINPPHATILAVGAGEQRVIVRDGRIDNAMMMTVTLSTDHRAVDGALGAELLAAFKRFIENPVMMIV
ncbi:Dihydrolipoyllysine-residue acetyltransferase component of pyruvate dehydrogenase complex [Platysternon megacephalum]|uniref:Acetyltransferase component of pyruvate dehydrogenase complex n=1 Tax=Platysternon megacephalum TaxID=55544 RepID=A0A4D9DBT3_9SAUR|nr:Dihydrolipoyllysine-residue acetyltransferase component of pyruvate dehydrogenase complex [Platysternon megacephalum]